MIPVDDFVFGDTGTESAPDQGWQEFWGKPVTRALDLQIFCRQLVSRGKRAGGHHALAGNRNVWEFTPRWSLDAGTKRRLNMADGCHHLPQLYRLEGSRMVRARERTIQREMLFNNLGAQGYRGDRNLDA